MSIRHLYYFDALLFTQTVNIVILSSYLYSWVVMSLLRLSLGHLCDRLEMPKRKNDFEKMSIFDTFDYQLKGSSCKHWGLFV